MKILTLVLLITGLIVSGCSSSPAPSTSSAPDNSSSANVPVSTTPPKLEKLDEKKAIEVIKQYLTQQSTRLSSFEFKSASPFSPGINSNEVGVRYKYYVVGSSSREERSGEARFARAQNGKWYLGAILGPKGAQFPGIEVR